MYTTAEHTVWPRSSDILYSNLLSNAYLYTTAEHTVWPRSSDSLYIVIYFPMVTTAEHTVWPRRLYDCMTSWKDGTDAYQI